MQTLLEESKKKSDYWYGIKFLAIFLPLIPFFGVWGDLSIQISALDFLVQERIVEMDTLYDFFIN